MEKENKMELKYKLCSLEPAKKLKELGVKQESYWYHYWWYAGSNNERIEWGIISKDFFNERMSKEIFERRYSVFTVAKLFSIIWNLDIKLYNRISLIGIVPTKIADYLALKTIDRLTQNHSI